MAPLEFPKPTNEKRGPLLIHQSEAGVPEVQLKSLNLEQFYPGDMSSVAKAPVKPMNNNPFLRDLYSNILHQVVYHLGHSPSLLSSNAVKEDK